MLRKLILFVLALIAGFILFQLATFPRVSRLADENPATTAFMDQRRAELRAAGESDQLQHQWVPYDRISPHLRSAVIVSEDSRFYQHDGIDTTELDRVVREAWEKKELGRGGSTITQQLAKNLYLSPSRNPWRKVKEILIAKRMEQTLSKKRILELYLNLVEFGETTYGAEAAARHYFGKPASRLTPSEAALLAGALPNPRKMNPGNPGPYLRQRRDIIVSRMRRWGYVAERSVTRSVTPGEESRSSAESTQPDTSTAPEATDEAVPPTETGTDPDPSSPYPDSEPLPPDFIPAGPTEPEPQDQPPPE